jgi:Mg2+ and Co2+ transporter CorA
MLRSEIPFLLDKKPARFAAFLLGEAFLGFLAIISVAFTFLQMWFPLTAAGDFLVQLAQWAIIGVFAVEYFAALMLARDKRGFMLNPWRAIDLATIAIPLLTLIPNVSNALRSSPVLRLVRLVRVASLGLRVSGVVMRERARQARNEAVGPVEVCVLPEGTGRKATSASWEEFLSWIKSPDGAPKWFVVSNLGLAELQRIATAAGLTPAFLESHLLNGTYPHVEVEQNHAALFTWLVEAPQHSPAQRNGVLLLISSPGIVTLTRRSTDLTKLVAGLRREPDLDKLPFPIRIACSILQLVAEQNERLATRLDAELGALEELPLRESRPSFFEHTFRLKKELSAAQSDLWRLKGVIAELAERRLALPGSDGGEVEFLKRLARDAEYLYETVINTRESLLSLIDLHLNVVSFDMNRVMRVLAVVSVLGLIPAVVGGLFGMNLIDNPWPYTLREVAFCVCFGMVLCLYLFFVKGWLR